MSGKSKESHKDEDPINDLGKESQQMRKHGTLILKAGKSHQNENKSSISDSGKKAVMALKAKPGE